MICAYSKIEEKVPDKKLINYIEPVIFAIAWVVPQKKKTVPGSSNYQIYEHFFLCFSSESYNKTDSADDVSLDTFVYLQCCLILWVLLIKTDW